MQTIPHLRVRFRFISLVLVVTTLALAALFLMGWFIRFDAYTQNQFLPGLNPVTSIALIIISLSFILIYRGYGHRVVLRSVLLVVGLTCIGRLVIFDLASLHSASSFSLQTIGPMTALNIVLLSVGLFFFSTRPIWLQVGSSIVFLTSLFGILSFLYDVPEPIGVLLFFPSPLFSGIAFIFLSIAALVLTGRHGWMKQLFWSMNESSAGLRLIISAICIPVIVGYLRMFGEWKHLISTALGVALLVLAVVIIFIFVAWRHIQEVNKGRAERMQLLTSLKRANEASQALNEELRAANEELMTGNEQLSIVNRSLQEANSTILLQRDEQLNRALEATNDVIWSRDLTGKHSNYVSRSAERIFSRSMDYLLKNHGFWFEGIHPDDISIITKLYSDLNANGEAECHFRIVDEEGRIRWLHSRPRLIKDSAGHTIREVGIISDVTTLFEAKEELQKYRENLDIIFNNTEEGILLADHTGKSVVFNRTFRNFILHATGKRLETGMMVWDMTVPERREISRSIFQQVMNGKSTVSEAHVRTPEGVVIHAVRYTPIFIGDTISHVCLVSSDITAQREAQLKLKQSEANLKAIFDNTVGAFSLLDRDLNLVAFNETNARLVKAITGMELVAGDSVFSTLAPERRAVFAGLIERVKLGESIRHQVKYVIDSNDRWFDVAITAVKDAEGNITGYCISSHDVTSQKTAEAEILRLNKSLQDFQNAIHRSSIVSMTDPAGNITFVNDNFVAISGYTREELIGNDHNMVSSHHHPRSFWLNMWQKISSGDVWRERVKNKRKDGSYYWVDTFVMPFVDEDGNVVQYLSIRNDITSIKEAEDDLLEERFILEEVNKVARVSYWLNGAHGREFTFSDEFLVMLGHAPTSPPVTIEDVLRNVFVEDVAKAHALFDGADTPPRKEIEFRVMTANAGTRWLYAKVEGGKFIDEEEKCIGILQDVTQRKMIEQVLREYNERYEILSKATNDAIWDLDLRLDVVTWNHALFDLFGYDERTVGFTTEWWNDKVHPEDFPRLLKTFEIAVKNQESNVSLTYRFRCADGTYKHVFNRAYILFEHQQAARIIGTMQDITERVRAMAEIEKLSLVASKTNNSVMITDQAGTIEWVNESFVRSTGYETHEVIGRNWEFLHGVQSDQNTIMRIREKMDRREQISEELAKYRKDRSVFWVRLDIAPVFDDAGNVKNFITIQSDISELKEFEKTIVGIARDLSSLIENANVPIFGIDQTGTIAEWNKVASELTGMGRSEVFSIHWKKVFATAQDNTSFRLAISAAFEGTATSNIEFPICRADGKKLILLLSASPRRNGTGEIYGIIFVGQNITELTEYRQNLERKVDERTRELHDALSTERELVKMKSQFVSIASHEFRTPLTTISLASGFIRKFKAKLTPEAIDDKLLNIEKQVTYMTHLLDDVLMVGKAEAGKIPVNKVTVSLKKFVRELSQEVTKSTGNSHQILLDLSSAPEEIVSDEKLLRNVLINLLTNAIKFSPDADIVKLKVEASDGKILISVIDRGIGIPDSDQRNLFQPFYRGGNVDSIQGTGLGLSIIKKALDLLGGAIVVKSQEGRGTEISIELPVS